MEIKVIMKMEFKKNRFEIYLYFIYVLQFEY